MSRLQLLPVSQIITFWRPGSQTDNWTWADEYNDLTTRDIDTTNRITARIHANGWEFADKTDPVQLGNDGRVWDGHHRIVIAIGTGKSHLSVKIIPDN